MTFTFDLLGGHLFSCREPLKGECLSFIEENVLCNCKIESSVKYFLPIQFKQVVFADVDDANVDVVVVVVVVVKV